MNKKISKFLKWGCKNEKPSSWNCQSSTFPDDCSQNLLRSSCLDCYVSDKQVTFLCPEWLSPVQHMLSFFPSSPNMSSLPTQVFGCVSLVHSQSHRGKLGPQAIKCILIGYPSNKTGYKCYHLQNLCVYVSMDVTFHEIELFIKVLNFTGRVV